MTAAVLPLQDPPTWEGPPLEERPSRIPRRGAARDALVARMQEMRRADANWRAGRTFSLVYHAGDEHQALLQEAHALFFSENGLNPMAFKSLKRMEADVVRMTAAMLHGDERVVGTMTSGGTESLLLAVKTYRDLARRQRPWISRPEMVLPSTAHVAFDKAAHYFGVKPRYAPVTGDFRADVAAMRRLVNRNTVLLVASAPQYPHGVVDPIEEIGALAAQERLPLHVDACIGGFVLPWVERLGYAVPRWDFRVPGVSSISADLHKYGYAAKGASVLCYRDMELLRHQFFVSTDWPGGIYASPSIPGTRPGGPIAAAWAALLSLGEEGYLEHTRAAMEATRRIVEGIGRIDGLRVLGAPHGTLVAWAAADKRLDVYAVADVLEDKGWHLDRQQRPASVHCTITSNHLAVVDEYLADVSEAVAVVRSDPTRRSRGNAAMYGMMAKVPFRGMVKDAVLDVMQGMYGPTGEVPNLSKARAGGIAGRLLDRYGDVALALLDRLEDARGLLSRRVRR